MKRLLPICCLLPVMVAACTPVDVQAPPPTFDTGVNPESWASIPAGEFFFGQHNDVEVTLAYEIMVTGAVKQAASGGKGIKFNRIKAVPSGAEAAYKLKYE